MIKILFLAANPLDTEPLQLDEESRAIDQALRLAEFRDIFDVRSHWAVRVSDLQELLLRYKPDIIHFSGHGSPAGEIILKEADGTGKAISAVALSNLFRILKDNIKCVLLNACFSQGQAEAIAEHIECVIGMSSAVSDATSIDFAAAFYQAVGYGRSIYTAFELACNRIQLEGLSEYDIPQLLVLHSDPKQLILSEQNGQSLSTKSPPVTNISTDGGSLIDGNVDTSGGDFIGRDKITINIVDSISPVLKKTFENWEPETVPISAGQFIMGSNSGSSAEAPMHILNLPQYSIGIYPVMNWQYAEYIWMTEQVASSFLLWNGNSPLEEEREYPVTGVTWFEVLEYCKWLSDMTGRNYTLPTEAQWEKAARGTDDRVYPWGNDWDSARCNHNMDQLVSVKQYEVQSDFGCYDMVGNAREWTSTLWGKSSDAPDPKYTYPWPSDAKKWATWNSLNEPPIVRRVYRGGRFSEPATYRCTSRGGYLPDRPGPRRNRHGFRVVLLSK